ncbi:beta-glucosidase 18-like [Ziziphus jujuba]|uniref:Beta-glucosidase 18-like n=1 Tax=Ziziphus jujuba TaxID=326968 RepID=A0ABM3I505_ZIZJJ|nr:beta-glucosidase 18-like [Ziziphus jujuba]
MWSYSFINDVRLSHKCLQILILTMKVKSSLLCFLLFIVVFFFFLVGSSLAQFSINENEQQIGRSQFPQGFLFGTSTSSYQVEGAYLEDGKGLSNWDVFSHIPGNILHNDNGDVADDHYHRYLEDIEIMHSLGVNAYRFSISWERILPRGRFGNVNPKGIEFYNKIIDNLLLRGIEPFVTIYHHEMPQILEDRYGGWLSHLIQEDFLHYAAVCFKEFGDRVKYWTTLNEANHIADFSYLIGQLPPMHCSPPFGNCSVGNSDVEPLIALHNMLMSHAKAANLYHKHFQAKQGGVVGIVVHAFMYEPFRDDEEVDREAVKRALAFNVAWMLDPLVYGEYPAEMRRYLGLDLPRFSDEEKELIRGSLDFIGLNHYSTLYAKDCIFSSCSAGGDRPIRGFLSTFTERDGIPIGEPTGMKTFFVVPRGMKKIVNYLKERYNNMPIFVTENGYSPKGEENEPVEDMLQDVNRIKFHKAYLAALASAIREGADVRGYFIWSLMDNFEWTHGYSVKFGLYYIDRISNSLQRTPKLSATWFTSFLTNTALFNRTTQVSVPPHNPNVIHNRLKSVKTANM